MVIVVNFKAQRNYLRWALKLICFSDKLFFYLSHQVIALLSYAVLYSLELFHGLFFQSLGIDGIYEKRQAVKVGAKE